MHAHVYYMYLSNDVLQKSLSVTNFDIKAVSTWLNKTMMSWPDVEHIVFTAAGKDYNVLFYHIIVNSFTFACDFALCLLNNMLLTDIVSNFNFHWRTRV